MNHERVAEDMDLSVTYLIYFQTKVASRARWYTPCFFACWGVSPIPTKTMINHRATLPLGADEITG